MTDTKKTDTKTPVAFIGLGMMGAHMAGHILSAGHPLYVYNRTRARAEGLIARGATWHDDAGAAASQAKIVITMVGLPRDVEEIYLGEGGNPGARGGGHDPGRHDDVEPIARGADHGSSLRDGTQALIRAYD
jgi:hypothetical protein